MAVKKDDKPSTGRKDPTGKKANNTGRTGRYKTKTAQSGSNVAKSASSQLPRVLKLAVSSGRVQIIQEKNGSEYVKMDVSEWNKIAKTVLKAQQEAMVKKTLTTAVKEVKEMISGKRPKSSLSDLLNEL